MRTARLVGLFVLALTGCGRTLFVPPDERCEFDRDCPMGLRCVNQECTTLELADGGPLFGKKRFGEPCDAGVQCGSTFCIGGPLGSFCSASCGATDGGACPSSYDCKQVPLQADGGSLTALCTVPQPLLCQSCAGDLECGASGADQCLALDGGSFCGRDCTFEACPSLYTCRASADGRRQCVPEGRTCDCTVDTLGLQKSCRGTANLFGACLGNQTCQADGGFTSCTAPLAQQETCNGADDDCNGRIDDFAPPECTKTVGNVTCRGPQVCFASAGLVCTARSPSTEVCNFEDDDCDGDIDEGFQTRGLYLTNEHCGGCNRDCSKLIPHATSTQCSAPVDAAACFALTCEPGFFVFQLGPTKGSICLQLPDTLCSACQVDADCVGPGSRCVTVDGAKVCGRDCAAGSAYGTTCPAGYSCLPFAGGGVQCAPSTGTCSCTATTQGTTRSCSLMSGAMTCRGFSTCGAGPQWSSCDVNSFNPEICDAKDNNCDGRIDEGFLNQATNRYEAAQHCGFCNNDCTKIFSPTIQHTNGVCDLAPAMPRCAMGPCLTETVGATTFEWVNVNGLPTDGCECRRVQGNTTIDLPDRIPNSGSGASYVDENCDGIDGVVTDAIFVSAGAAAGGNGTRTSPFQTIAAGVTAQQAQGKRYVLVAQGLYRENVRLFDGAQIFGGYSQDFLARDVRLYSTNWQGVAPTVLAIAPVHADTLGAMGAARETVVSGFTILGWDATQLTPPSANGETSIGVYLRDVGPRFVLQNNDIIGGRGGAGGRGATGAQGFGRQASNALNGTRGVNSQFFPSGACGAMNQRNGGTAGVNMLCPTSNGEAGGNVVCPVYNFPAPNPNTGAQQMFVNPLPPSRSGPGGFDWSFDPMSGGQCGHVTESGWPTAIQQHDGQDGKPGADGSSGVGGGGAAARARFGSFVGGRWVAAPSGAVAGAAGVAAQGGGGGGAGGGVSKFAMGGCQGWEIGATGGGAGAGGCGGTGGNFGGAGGGSFAVFIASSTAGAALPTLLNNRIQRGAGGNGGDGGFGGAGGLGGGGGFGGLAARWSSSVGGKGGEGGNGGPGGGGGGGSGGPSFGLLSFNVPLMALSATNTFLTGAVIDTGGPGGAGGSSPGGGMSSGSSGARGASANQQAIFTCGGPCPGMCDVNGVCIPP